MIELQAKWILEWWISGERSLVCVRICVRSFSTRNIWFNRNCETCVFWEFCIHLPCNIGPFIENKWFHFFLDEFLCFIFREKNRFSFVRTSFHTKYIYENSQNFEKIQKNTKNTEYEATLSLDRFFDQKPKRKTVSKFWLLLHCKENNESPSNRFSVKHIFVNNQSIQIE